MLFCRVMPRLASATPSVSEDHIQQILGASKVSKEKLQTEHPIMPTSVCLDKRSFYEAVTSASMLHIFRICSAMLLALLPLWRFNVNLRNTFRSDDACKPLAHHPGVLCIAHVSCK